MLKCQNNRIESLNFSFLLTFNQDIDEPERIVPNLPSETVDVKSLTVRMVCSEDLTYQIVQFVKPNLHYLNLSMTVIDVTLPSRVGDLEQVKTAEKVYSLLELSREQSMELQGYEIVNKSTHLVDSDIADLLKVGGRRFRSRLSEVFFRQKPHFITLSVFRLLLFRNRISFNSGLAKKICCASAYY